MDYDGENTGLRHDDKITGVYGNNKSAESVSMGATDKADKLALIEEAFAESE